MWKLYLTVLNSISPSYLQINDNLNNIENFPIKVLYYKK